jgi:hypothetical protein
VVADDPGRTDRRDAVARRILPRLRHEPGDRSPERRPASPRIGRYPRAGIALLVVPGIGADAENSRFACPAASREGHGLEPVIGAARRCSGARGVELMPQKAPTDS